MKELYNSEKPFYSNNSLSRLTKVYVWSVLTEPLLYFILFGHPFGISSNLSRFIQLFVLVCLFFKILLLKSYNWTIFRPSHPYYRWYFFFIICAIFSGAYGAAIGAYSVSFLTLTDTMVVSIYRPIFEYFVAIYYFFYFVILAKYMIRSPKAVDYFFLTFKRIFFFILFVGFFDLLLIWIYQPDYGGIPRHYDEYQVGFRFHSFTGEPRDAFVFLVLGLGLLWAKDIWMSEKKLNYRIIFLIAVAGLMTQSFSGVLGLIFSTGLVLLYFVPKAPTHKFFIIIFVSVLIPVVAIIYAKFFSPRILTYFNEMQVLFYNLNNQEIIAPVMMGAMNNFYPIWQRWIELIQFDVIGLFFGTGFGSSSVSNVNFYLENNVFNPNSSLIRTFYDNGIIGVFILIAAFLSPIKHLDISKSTKNKCMLYMIFILGAYFAHRSSAPFIFLGIVLIIFDYRFRAHFLK